MILGTKKVSICLNAMFMTYDVHIVLMFIMFTLFQCLWCSHCCNVSTLFQVMFTMFAFFQARDEYGWSNVYNVYIVNAQLQCLQCPHFFRQGMSMAGANPELCSLSPLPKRIFRVSSHKKIKTSQKNIQSKFPKEYSE